MTRKQTRGNHVLLNHKYINENSHRHTTSGKAKGATFKVRNNGKIQIPKILQCKLKGKEKNKGNNDKGVILAVGGDEIRRRGERGR